MAWTKVSLDPSTWTQVSAASATEVTLFLPKSIKRKWSDDSIAVVVADSAPSAGESDLEIYLQNNPDQPLSKHCLLYTSPSPRDRTRSRMPSSA